MPIRAFLDAIKNQLRETMVESGWDEVRASAEIMYLGNRTRVHETVYYKKDGKIESEPFGLSFTEFEEIPKIIPGEQLGFLYIQADQDTIEIYADKDFEAFGLAQAPFLKDPLKLIQEAVNPCIEGDEVYANAFHIAADGACNGYMMTFMKHDRNRHLKLTNEYSKVDEFDETAFLLAFKAMVAMLPKGKKVKVFIRKDQPIEIHTCSGQEIVEDILLFHVGHDEVAYEVSFQPEDGKLKLQLDGYIKRGDEMLAMNWTPKQDFESLYYMLGEAIDVLAVKRTSTEKVVLANKPFAEFGIGLLNTRPEIDPTDLEQICQLLESRKADKIMAALEACDKNEETKARIEKRYLTHIVAYTGNQGAQLSDFSAEMFPEAMVDSFVGFRPNVGKDYIEYDYCNQEESKHIIDFMGAMTASFIDVEAFSEAHKSLINRDATPEELRKLSASYFTQLKKGIEKEAKLNSKGWFSRSYQHLLKSNINRVLTNKSNFFGTDQLPYLKEYMFFLNASANGNELYFDVANTINFHDPTEIYWMFDRIPDINWHQTDPVYSKSPYGNKRKARMKVDGQTKWGDAPYE